MASISMEEMSNFVACSFVLDRCIFFLGMLVLWPKLHTILVLSSRSVYRVLLSHRLVDRSAISKYEMGLKDFEGKIDFLVNKKIRNSVKD